MPNRETASLSEIIECLEKTYCGHFSVEINHLSVSLSEEISKEKEINYHMQNTRNSVLIHFYFRAKKRNCGLHKKLKKAQTFC